MCRRARCGSIRSAPARSNSSSSSRTNTSRSTPQPGLLEAGPALSRRHRIHDHARSRRRATWPSSPGKFDVIPLSVTIPTLKDFKEQAPQAICEVRRGNVPRTMLINPHEPPFDNPELRRAMASGLRPQGVPRHPQRGQGADRRRHDAAARAASGACRRRCCRRCPAMGPTWKRTAPKRARSWRSSATGRTSRWRSRYRRATFRLGATRR